MHYHIISIFPEIFDSFLTTSLIYKAQEKKLIQVNLVNPRDFCIDKHKQIDDMPYGWGSGMVLKAKPIINAIQYIIGWIDNTKNKRIKVCIVWPSKEEFSQQLAHAYTETYDHIIFICGRYEGIDRRVQDWCEVNFWMDFSVVSVGKYITLWWEVPAMVMIEATARLLPGVIKEELSRQDESYRPEEWWKNLEYPQYTRPEEVMWMGVPEILFSGHHAKIDAWRKDMWENNTY